MLLHTLVIMGILLAILATFSRAKHTTVKTTYIPAYTSSHAELYDVTVYDHTKNEAEIQYLSPLLTSDSHVLDVGSGTGHHVDALQQKGVQVIGMDVSTDMIVAAKKRYPHTYMQGDALNTSTFSSESFTHITCLYFTIYCMKDKRRFFQNAYHWLTPGGYLCLHLSNQWTYGPVSSFSELRYTSKHTSRVHRECITFQGKQACFEHKIYMEAEETIADMAIQSGFTLSSIYTYSMPYKNQRLYVFRK